MKADSREHSKLQKLLVLVRYIGCAPSRSMILILLFLFSLNTVTCQLVQPAHSGLTQQATGRCFRRNGSYVLTLEIQTKLDVVAIVYAVNPTDYTQNTIGSLDSLGNGIAGTGSDSDPYRIEYLFQGSLNSLTTTQPATTWPNGTVEINVITKNRIDMPNFHQVYFRRDVLWSAICDFAAPEAIIGTSTLIIVKNIVEDATIVKDDAKLEVYSDTFNQPTGVALPTDLLYLVLSLGPGSKAVGIYGYNCYACGNSNCEPAIQTFQFINDIGCSINPYMSNFVKQGTVVRTQNFIPFTFDNLPQSSVFFYCQPGFCYEQNQFECANYCLSNSIGKRRKRDAVSPTESAKNLSTVVIIKFPSTNTSNDKSDAHQGDGTTNGQALLIATVILAALLAILLIIGLVVFIRMRSTSVEKTIQ